MPSPASGHARGSGGQTSERRAWDEVPPGPPQGACSRVAILPRGPRTPRRAFCRNAAAVIVLTSGCRKILSPGSAASPGFSEDIENVRHVSNSRHGYEKTCPALARMLCSMMPGGTRKLAAAWRKTNNRGVGSARKTPQSRAHPPLPWPVTAGWRAGEKRHESCTSA